MEITGLGLSLRAPELVSKMLITTCLDVYRVFSNVREFKNFGNLYYRFEIEHLRLKDWAAFSGSPDTVINKNLLDRIYAFDDESF